MKRVGIAYYPLLYILALVCQDLKSQDIPTVVKNEGIEVCTDRTLYVSGEKINFSLLLCHVEDKVNDQVSKIVYGELISPEGNRIAGGKYMVQSFNAEGCLTIPEEVISGIYYLKFYTRNMRNNPVVAYKFLMVKIINPLKTEVLRGIDAADTTYNTFSGKQQATENQLLTIRSENEEFTPGQEVKLEIKASPGISIPDRLCLSVIPESTSAEFVFPVRSKPNPAKPGIYMPETRGISLSGQVVGKESGKPVPEVVVNLSIIGDKDFLAVRSDTTGRFYFALPEYSGNRDLFMCTGDLPGISTEILIDNDFCSRPVALPSPLFTLSGAEMLAAYKLAVNSRITSFFRQDKSVVDTVNDGNKIPFYGKPSEVLVVDKFIELPSLGEYFTELPGSVKIRKVQGKRQFRFYATAPEMSLFNPLMLVDWVAVDDIEKILAMSPTEIDRIELVDAPYMKGSVTYGGIISFVSKKNNFAGIDLPTSGTFVNYSFLEPCYSSMPQPPGKLNIPDSRNTIFWNPGLELSHEGLARVSFIAPATPGKYTIWLQGMRNKGERVSTRKTIVVTEK
ncbi:MAG: hypothetical protein ACOYNC_14015 [Bacteroidales bacterium]